MVKQKIYTVFFLGQQCTKFISQLSSNLVLLGQRISNLNVGTALMGVCLLFEFLRKCWTNTDNISENDGWEGEMQQIIDKSNPTPTHSKMNALCPVNALIFYGQTILHLGTHRPNEFISTIHHGTGRWMFDRCSAINNNFKLEACWRWCQ